MTREDVKILSARLDTLSRKIDELAAPAPLILTPDELTAPVAQIAQATAKTRRPRQTKAKSK